MDAARAALIHLLCNYQGMRRCRVIVVFDAYRVKGGSGTSEREAGVEIVYTREGETADAYIERLSYEFGRTHRVKVATGDGLEQLVVLGHGAQRLTAPGALLGSGGRLTPISLRFCDSKENIAHSAMVFSIKEAAYRFTGRKRDERPRQRPERLPDRQ